MILLVNTFDDYLTPYFLCIILIFELSLLTSLKCN